MKKILVIDNYDSFTYNLVHYLNDLNCDVTVKRNDKLRLEEVEKYDKILLSPGPGIPDEAGLLKPIIKEYAASKSILGVCLGQQAIAEVFGGKIENLNKVYHGVSSTIERINEDTVLYKNIPKKIEVGRYHSWVVCKDLPDVLEVTSLDENGEIMSLRHKEFDVRAVQYHPESILTNWVEA
jgi:anthranilate synthase component 2